MAFHPHHRPRLIAVAALALATAPAGLAAQARVTVSPGVAVGTVLSPAGPGAAFGSPTWARGRHALLTLDVAAVGVPMRLRGEAMVVGPSRAYHGPLSLGANVVLPVGGGRLRPYALAGAAVYGVGGVGHPTGVNAGAGVEYRRRAATLFLEARRHSEIPSAVSLGVRF